MTLDKKSPVSGTEIKRLDETLTRIEKGVEKEVGHLEDWLEDLDEGQKRLQSKLENIPGHQCIHIDQIMESEKSIKRLYVWQAGIGLSALIFFLTMGVAALRFIDRLEMNVQQNTESIDKLERRMEKHDQESDESLKELIKAAIQESK